MSETLEKIFGYVSFSLFELRVSYTPSRKEDHKSWSTEKMFKFRKKKILDF